MLATHCITRYTWCIQTCGSLHTQINKKHEKYKKRTQYTVTKKKDWKDKIKMLAKHSIKWTTEDLTKCLHWNIAAWHERDGWRGGYSLLLMPSAVPRDWNGATWENSPTVRTRQWLSEVFSSTVTMWHFVCAAHTVPSRQYVLHVNSTATTGQTL
jgi:hypothetical protein